MRQPVRNVGNEKEEPKFEMIRVLLTVFGFFLIGGLIGNLTAPRIKYDDGMEWNKRGQIECYKDGGIAIRNLDIIDPDTDLDWWRFAKAIRIYCGRRT